VSFDLAEVRSVKLVDEGARRDVNEFANASASARRRDAKAACRNSDAPARARCWSVTPIAAPIWKTTYRVVLDQSGKPFFQGWAIVDNVGDEDWNNISLSLISGRQSRYPANSKTVLSLSADCAMPTDLKLSRRFMSGPGAAGGYANAAGAGGPTGLFQATDATLGDNLQRRQITPFALQWPRNTGE